jgi:hypothetical protein
VEFAEALFELGKENNEAFARYISQKKEEIERLASFCRSLDEIDDSISLLVSWILSTAKVSAVVSEWDMLSDFDSEALFLLGLSHDLPYSIDIVNAIIDYNVGDGLLRSLFGNSLEQLRFQFEDIYFHSEKMRLHPSEMADAHAIFNIDAAFDDDIVSSEKMEETLAVLSECEPLMRCDGFPSKLLFYIFESAVQECEEYSYADFKIAVSVSVSEAKLSGYLVGFDSLKRELTKYFES